MSNCLRTNHNHHLSSRRAFHWIARPAPFYRFPVSVIYAIVSLANGPIPAMNPLDQREDITRVTFNMVVWYASLRDIVISVEELNMQSKSL